MSRHYKQPAQEQDDEEEDYMSSSFVQHDIRPGISTSKNHLRELKSEALRETMEKKQKEALERRPKRKHEIEKKLLNEGLNKPIEADSKGFSLLAKMGYKPGMSLGKKREGEDEGIKEPISIQMRAGKSGLGHEEEEKEKQKERCEAHLRDMAEKAGHTEALTEDFIARKRDKLSQKQLLGDLRRIRKVCHDLDTRSGLELPSVDWFWPAYRANEQQTSAPAEKRRRSDGPLRVESPSVEKYSYANKREAPPEPRFYEFGEDELIQMLGEVVTYVRQSHFYCLWCGTAFDSAGDLQTNCPGPSRQHHDE